MEPDDGLVDGRLRRILNNEFGTLTHFDFDTLNHVFPFAIVLLGQFFLFLPTLETSDAFVDNLRVLCHSVLLLDHFIEPYRQQIHQEPSVQYDQNGSELRISVTQILETGTVRGTVEAYQVNGPAEGKRWVEQDGQRYNLRVGVDEGGDGLTYKAAEYGEEVSYDSGAFGAVDEYLDEVGHGYQSHCPSQQKTPEHERISLNEHGQPQIVPSKPVKYGQHDQSYTHIEQEPTDPIVLDIQTIHLHDLDKPFLLLVNYCIQKQR
jgi:hypothetical protein